ncbi:GNAT family N-acetyltransferase [Neobacillus niacini]|uniref:GNAT family N-acetyltransferase n=1 Tax=Neobacillus niacini TaxID=86668 RepID=UPI0037C761EC
MVYEDNPNEGPAKQVGFARVVSDLVRFSWIGDVFILPEYRGRRLSKWLIRINTEHLLNGNLYMRVIKCKNNKTRLYLTKGCFS